MNAGIVKLGGEASAPMPYALLGAPTPIPAPHDSIHPEVVDWHSRVMARGGSCEYRTLKAASNFCAAIDAAGLRNRFARLNLMCGNTDPALVAVRTPLYLSRTPNGERLGFSIDHNFNFVAGDYTETGASGGLLGNAVNKYLNTGLITDLFASLHDGHLSYYAPQWTPSAVINPGSAAIGAQQSGGAALIFARGNSGTCGGSTAAHVGSIGSTGGNLCGEVGNDAGGGHTMISRIGSAVLQATLYRNGSSAVSGNANTYLASNLPAYVFAFAFWLSGAVSVGGFAPIRMRGYSLGYGMNETQVAAFYSALQTFQAALGRNV